MSCNGCRVLRKGCSESCILRHCLQSIESPESQGHATVFVAKFFGRAGLMSFISAVPESQRPALFQSLLFEACGRTVNPVHGAVGLLWTGNWQVCQSAVDTVLRGGALRPLPEFVGGGPTSTPSSDEASETCTETWRLKEPINASSRFSNSRSKRKRAAEDVKLQPAELDLCLTPTYPIKKFPHSPKQETRRPETPSMTSEESETTTCFESCVADQYGQRSDADERKLLNLFV